jgi:hypothetical protein
LLYTAILGLLKDVKRFLQCGLAVSSLRGVYDLI